MRLENKHTDEDIWMWAGKIFFTLREHSCGFLILKNYPWYRCSLTEIKTLICLDLITPNTLVCVSYLHFKTFLYVHWMQILDLFLFWGRWQYREKCCRLSLCVGAAPGGVWAGGAPASSEVYGTCSKIDCSEIKGGIFTNGSTNHRHVGKPHIIIHKCVFHREWTSLSRESILLV